MFNYLKIMVKEIREEEKTKIYWIPLGRLNSYILTENKLIEHQSESQQLSELETSVGKTINAKNLKNMKIVDHIKDPIEIVKEVISIRRIPLDDSHIFTQEYPPEVITRYLDVCKKDRTTPDIDI